MQVPGGLVRELRMMSRALWMFRRQMQGKHLLCRVCDGFLFCISVSQPCSIDGNLLVLMHVMEMQGNTAPHHTSGIWICYW